ncbi:YceI family protein [Chelatococcus sp. GCM10030263]|uniref:YceI family protein n=1 Tax=Chelatococcus sp. GCM10030263 TaxID=3273387 RepID=UPI00361E8F56
MRPMLRTLAVLVAALTTVTPALAQATFRIDPARTRIAFVIDAIGFPQTRGEFRQFMGRLLVDFDRPQRSRVTFEVSAASLDTKSPGLDDYIRSSAFLNVGQYPNISFSSVAVEKLDEQTVRVAGDLTMLGVTRPALFTVVVDRTAGRRGAIGFRAQGTIRRSQFGMISGQPLISDNVTITVSTEALPQ